MRKLHKRKQLEGDRESRLNSSIRNQNPREPRMAPLKTTPEECRAVRDILLALHGFPQGFAKYRTKSTDDAVKLAQDDDTWLPAQEESVLDGLVRTVLSQNTTEVLSAGAKDVEDAIRCGGLAPTKSSCIKNVLSCLLERSGKLCLEYLRDLSLDDLKSELSLFKGIGPKTESCVLMFNLQRDDFPVDRHTFEIAKTIGWVPAVAYRNKTYPQHAEEGLVVWLRVDVMYLMPAVTTGVSRVKIVELTPQHAEEGLVVWLVMVACGCPDDFHFTHISFTRSMS